MVGKNRSQRSPLLIKMKIWILDPDVSFALHAKQFLQKKDRKIEVFFEIVPFREALQKSKRDKESRPDLIFIEVNLQGEEGYDLFEEILNSCSFLSGKICFLSHVGFGTFKKEVERRGINEPLFLSKNRFEKDVEKIIETLQEKKEEVISPDFRSGRARQEFKKIVAALNDFYYEGSKTKGVSDPVEDKLDGLLAQARFLNLLALVEKGERVKSIYAKGKGGMRGKRELKDFLVLCEKESKKWKE